MAAFPYDLNSWANASEEECLIQLSEADLSFMDQPGSIDLNPVCTTPAVHVRFEDIKKEYEKVQRKMNKREAQIAGGPNRQMVTEGKVHFFVSGSEPVSQYKISAYVRRTAEAARNMPSAGQDYTTEAEMNVCIVESNVFLNQLRCQVDMSTVYHTKSNKPVFELSTTRTTERNQFEIIVGVQLTGLSDTSFFSSPSFLVKSKEAAGKKRLNREGPSPGKSRWKGIDTTFSSSESGSPGASSPSSPGIGNSAHFESLTAEHAFIRELEVVKFLTRGSGDIGYHFPIKEKEDGSHWREGTVVVFLPTSDGETQIEELSPDNVGKAKLAGVITRSAYLESTMLVQKDKSKPNSDVVCIMGTVKVSMLGNVLNGEAVFASSVSPGTAVSKSSLQQTGEWHEQGLIMLGQALESRDSPGPNVVHEVQCLVSLFLGIQSREIVQVVKEQREISKVVMKRNIKREKKKITRNTVCGLVISVIFVILLGLMLREFVSRSTAFQYYLCKKGMLDTPPACLKFRSPLTYNQTRKVKGYEFTWEVLKHKLSLDMESLEEAVGSKDKKFRYFLNIDRCAYTRIWFRNRADNHVLVLQGLEVFAMVYQNGASTLYHVDDDEWEPLKSKVKVKSPC